MAKARNAGTTDKINIYADFLEDIMSARVMPTLLIGPLQPAMQIQLYIDVKHAVSYTTRTIFIRAILQLEYNQIL